MENSEKIDLFHTTPKQAPLASSKAPNRSNETIKRLFSHFPKHLNHSNRSYIELPGKDAEICEWHSDASSHRTNNSNDAYYYIGNNKSLNNLFGERVNTTITVDCFFFIYFSIINVRVDKEFGLVFEKYTSNGVHKSEKK